MAWNQGRRRGGGPGQRSPEAPVPCPQCGGPMWDNSLTKTNPKAPDYQCKDSTCVDPESGYRTALWASDTQKMAAQGTAAAKGQPTAPNGKRVLIIDKLMGVCLDAAKTALTEKLGKVEMSGEATATLTVNLATTMYISRTRDNVGIMSIEKESLAAAARKAAEEAERKRLEAEAAAARQRQDDTGWDQETGPDDDLPF